MHAYVMGVDGGYKVCIDMHASLMQWPVSRTCTAAKHTRPHAVLSYSVLSYS